MLLITLVIFSKQKFQYYKHFLIIFSISNSKNLPYVIFPFQLKTSHYTSIVSLYIHHYLKLSYALTFLISDLNQEAGSIKQRLC